MGFNPPVPQRDSDWEIRAAMLLSLSFQVLLIFVGPFRKRTASPVARFASWSCYLLADWVADLALGLLVNNLGNIGGNGPPSVSSWSGGGANNNSRRGGGGVVATVDGGGGGGPAMFAFWTPFLLLHLGGQDTITAYSIEDNQLWRRHLIGLLFQLFSALVVFSCTLEGNPMIPATVLMFVAGIIKYGERTYSLYSGSVDGGVASILPAPDPGPNYAKLMSVFSGMHRAGLDVDVVVANGQASKLEAARQESEVTRHAMATGKALEAQAYYLFTVCGRRVCYDINVGHKERMISQAFFLDRADMTKPGKAVEVIEAELNFIYDMVHTKEPVAHTLPGLVLRFVSSACIVSSVAAFCLLDKGGIQRVDVDITYALLLGALALDVASLVVLLFSSDWTMVFLKDESSSWPLVSRLLGRVVEPARRWLCPERPRWSKMTSQLNLIDYSLDKPDGEHSLGPCTRLAKVVAYKLRAGLVFDEFFFVRRKKPTSFVNKLKHTAEDLRNPNNNPNPKGDDEGSESKLMHAAEDLRNPNNPNPKGDDEGSKSKLKHVAEDLRNPNNPNPKGDDEGSYDDIEAMRKASSYRGEKAISVTKEEMRKKKTMGTTNKLVVEEIHWDTLMDSVIKRDFDESLLMWHIATDLCCCISSHSGPSTAAATQQQDISTSLSEYMLYLLVMQPKVLAASAGVGQVAYQDTCAEARRLFRSATVHCDPDHRDARRVLLGTCTSVPPEKVKGGRSKSVLFPACIVAKELLKLDEEARCKLLAGVWVEMLTYAAAKCKGTTHVHHLARGGELITVVWLLMTHMGIGNIYQKKVAVWAKY
ncbi:hypothetical protein U9M48_004528 [Paspalum notatum var. saurae]|uniref:DUF4220 domain-containing protein n=1 Tax=Paspalum notatum var. saurae TaxID=547442 RepID=A0AAQ3PVR2_PASNO